LPVEPLEKRQARLESIRIFLAGLPFAKPWEVLVRPPKTDRSERQNNALWGVAYPPLIEHTGHTGPRLHDHFLREWFGEVEYEVCGKKRTRPRRTTTTDEQGKRDLLGTDEFASFYSFLQQQGAEIGVYIPDPDPLLRVRAA
jgi:hypothetical protein